MEPIKFVKFITMMPLTVPLTVTLPDHDSGDEDDIASCPRRMWPRFYVGPGVCYQPLSWTHERLPPLPGHDPGDEDWFTWWQPLSELSERRVYRQLFGGYTRAG